KVGTGFRKTSCSSKKLERDGDSKKSHHALMGWPGRPPARKSATWPLSGAKADIQPRTRRRLDAPHAWPSQIIVRRRRTALESSARADAPARVVARRGSGSLR